jgi:hypothetical protein
MYCAANADNNREKHPNLDYTQLEPSFTCVLTEAETALGLRFLSVEHESLFIQHLDTLIQMIEGLDTFFKQITVL